MVLTLRLLLAALGLVAVCICLSILLYGPADTANGFEALFNALMSELNSLPQELVVWGKSILSETVASLGDRGFDRPIILTVPPLATMNGEYVQAKLKNRVGVFTDLLAHAPDVGICSGLKAYVEAGAHSIVAHGGGSVLDAARAVSYLPHQQTGRYPTSSSNNS
jgi:alcohol dehydrogenase class IV